MEYNIYAVVIIYNKSIDRSITINNLRKIGLSNLKIVVVDNSTTNFENEELCGNCDVDYISMNGNAGLSKAYNKALDYLKNKTKSNDFIIWLDDDSNIKSEYFDALETAIFKYEKTKVFAPYIIGQDNVIYSPNNASFLRNNLLKEKDDFKLHKFNAINSCLAVKSEIYKNYRYDESLFLDMVDQNFFDDLREQNYKFGVLNIEIHHNFSQREDDINIASMNSRLKIRIKDLMTYAKKKKTYTFLAIFKTIGWGIVLGWKCKSIKLFSTAVLHSLFGFLKNIKWLFYSNKDLVNN